jgi:L-asparaginase
VTDGTLPRIALIATGGTIGALADDPLEILDYGGAGRLGATELVARCPALGRLALIEPVDFSSVPSPAVHLPHWLELLALCDRLVRERADLAGIVVTHGTASLEETAYFLSLVCPLPIPIVLVGAQRPPSAASTDAFMNIAQAIRVAALPEARVLGPLVVMNGEIHVPRDVRKTSNLGMDTFRSPDLGPIGLVAGLEPRILRRPLHRAGPQSAFAGATIATLPRVDILYCHAGADAVAAHAFIAAGARGIVLAGMPPGYPTATQAEVLSRWCREDGGIVVYASRADGPTVPNARNIEAGFLASAGLSPVKARLLLALALACGRGKLDLPAIFRDH